VGAVAAENPDESLTICKTRGSVPRSLVMLLRKLAGRRFICRVKPVNAACAVQPSILDRITERVLRSTKPLRRGTIEPMIGHMKNDGRLTRCPLKGTAGDAIFAVLCGCGHNIRMILRHLRVVLRQLFWLISRLSQIIDVEMAPARSERLQLQFSYSHESPKIKKMKTRLSTNRAGLLPEVTNADRFEIAFERFGDCPGCADEDAR